MAEPLKADLSKRPLSERPLSEQQAHIVGMAVTAFIDDREADKPDKKAGWRGIGQLVINGYGTPEAFGWLQEAGYIKRKNRGAAPPVYRTTLLGLHYFGVYYTPEPTL